MRQKILVAVLMLAAASTASFSQTQDTRARAGADSATSVGGKGGQLDIASGTRLKAQLQNTLDVSKARVGDRVVLKTTEAIKSNGETLVKKGAHLVGRVADVRRKAKGSAESSVTLLFDRLESGSLSAPLSVVINSVTQAGARGRVGDEEMSAGAGAASNTSARTQGGGSGGGLLGGVTGAVGNTVGGATNAAGNVVGGATETVGGTVNGVGRTLGRVRVTQSADASAEGGSTLSLTGGNLLLEKGTTFNLTVSGSASVNN